MKKLRWPPLSLGLGTHLNLALLSPEARSRARSQWWLVPLLGVVTPAAMLLLDRWLFGGASLDRLRALGAEPFGYRVLILLYSAVTEELLYRLGLATLFAWIAVALLPKSFAYRKATAQWSGIAVAALLFGLAHVANLPDVAHPVLRAVVVNGVAGLIFGWLYFWRGLDMAILTHLFAIAILYLVLPPLL